MLFRSIWLFVAWCFGIAVHTSCVSNGEMKLAGTLPDNSNFEPLFTWWGMPLASCILLGLCFLIGTLAVRTVHSFSSGLLIGNWIALIMAFFVSVEQESQRWLFVFGAVIALPVTSHIWVGSYARLNPYEHDRISKPSSILSSPSWLIDALIVMVIRTVKAVWRPKSRETPNFVSSKTQPIARNREFGTNRIKKHIGSGSSSEVYLGESKTGEQVAIKVLGGKPGQPTAVAEAIRREYEVLRHLRSGGVANLVSHGLEDAPPWIATEYIEGLSLREYIEVHGPMNHVESRALLYRLAGILAELQEQGGAHRDLSPNNIILGRQGPVLVDFGLGRIDLEHPITGSYLIHGTQGYTAPEATKGEPVGTPADIYALSQIQSFILTGEHPITSHTEMLTGIEGDALRRAAGEDPRHRPNASELVEILRCDTAGVYEQWFEQRELPELPRRISPLSLSIAAVVPLVATVGIGWLLWPESLESTPVSANSLVAALDDIATTEVNLQTREGGWFQSVPYLFNWPGSQTSRAQTFEVISTTMSPAHVVEAHMFTPPISDKPWRPPFLLAALSVEAEPNARLKPSPIDQTYLLDNDSLLYEKFLKGLAEFELSTDVACSLEASDDRFEIGEFAFFLASDHAKECREDDRYRLYVSGSSISLRHSPNFRIEIFADTPSPVPVSALLTNLSFRESGLQIWSEMGGPDLLTSAAGWEDWGAAQSYVQRDGDTEFTAVLSVPADSGLILSSKPHDATIYETQLLFSRISSLTFPLGQWVPYNAAVDSFVEDEFTLRDTVYFPSPLGTTEPNVVIVTAQPASKWRSRSTLDEREPFYDRTPIQEWAPMPPLAFFFWSEPVDEQTTLIREMTAFADPWLTRPEFESGYLTITKEPEPDSMAPVGLPHVLLDSEELDVVDAWSSHTVGPEGLELQVGLLPVVRSGEIDGDPFFEGSKQFLGPRDREAGLSSRLRLYFGQSGPLVLGESWFLRYPLASIESCMGEQEWVVENNDRSLELRVRLFVECRIAVPGGIADAPAPLFAFDLREEDNPVPLLMADYVPADLSDLDHLQRMLVQIFGYMTDMTPGHLDRPATAEVSSRPPGIDSACVDAQEGSTLYAEFYNGKIDDQTKFIADYLLFAALDSARAASTEDEQWRELAALIYDLQIALENNDWDAVGQVTPEILSLCGIN
jgi:tRNA A-37 threonylcarbamoyl transferase component Bud32